MTNRIGNRNVTPQTVVSGVQSPRQLDADDLEAGVHAMLGETSLTLAVEYRMRFKRDVIVDLDMALLRMEPRRAHLEDLFRDADLADVPVAVTVGDALHGGQEDLDLDGGIDP